MRQCPDQCCEAGGEKTDGLLVVLHLLLGGGFLFGLFFVYAAQFLMGGDSLNAEKKKRISRGFGA